MTIVEARKRPQQRSGVAGKWAMRGRRCGGVKINYSRGAVSGDAKRGPGPRQYRGNRASLPGTMARPADSNVVAADGGSSGGGDGGGSQWKRGLTALLAHHPATSATQPSVTVRISRALDAIMLVFLSSKPITCRPPPLASAAAVPPPAPACTCAAACAGTGGREEEGPSSVSRQHAAASPTPALSPAARPHRTAPLCIASHRIASHRHQHRGRRRRGSSISSRRRVPRRRELAAPTAWMALLERRWRAVVAVWLHRQ